MKQQIHQSMIGMLERCGEQFRRRYGFKFGYNDLEEIIPPGVALITGIATHKAVEQNLINKIQTGFLLPLEAVKDFARDSASGLWQQEVYLQEDEAANVEQVKGDCIDTAISLSVLHAKELAPKLSPVAVERKWVVELKGYPFDLAGMIDIEEILPVQNSDNFISVIRDTKTAAKSPNADAANISFQLSIYAMAKLIVDKMLPDKIYLDSLVKTKVPKLIVQETARTQGQIQTALHRIERAIEIIEKGAFTPARPDDYLCNSRWCGYATSCKFYGGRK